MRYHLILVKMVITQKTKDNQFWPGHGEKRTLEHSGGNVNKCSHYRKH
jgi:hypothetical protein